MRTRANHVLMAGRPCWAVTTKLVELEPISQVRSAGSGQQRDLKRPERSKGIFESWAIVTKVVHEFIIFISVI